MKDEIIDNYIKGKLESADKQAFEEEMKTDNELAKEVELRNYLTKHWEFEAMIEEAHDNMVSKKKTTEDVEIIDINKKKHSSSNNSGFSKNRRMLGMVATITILILSGVGYANLNYSNQKLVNFDSIASIAPILTNVNNGIRSNSQKFANGLIAFQDNKYQEAVAQFEGIPEIAGDEYIQAQVYIAYAYWHLNNPQKTKEATEKISKISKLSSDKKQIVEWLLIQSKLSLDETDEYFYELLRTIKEETNHTFSNDAKELSNKLNNPWRKLVW